MAGDEVISSDRSVRSEASREEFSKAGNRKLAELRLRIRQFLHFDEKAAPGWPIEPQRHRLLAPALPNSLFAVVNQSVETRKRSE